MYQLESIVYEDYNLAYRYYECSSENVLFLFHGFGQSSAVFETFIPTVLPQYTVISIELFFHGGSTINTSQTTVLTIETWNRLFSKILAKHQIKIFSIFAYSMGGRYALTTLLQQSSFIDKIVLIAPDGFGTNGWMSIATSTNIGRLMFRTFLEQTFLITGLSKFLQLIGGIDAATHRFINRTVATTAQRTQLYYSWVFVRKLFISPKEFISFVQANKIKCLVVVGAKDQFVEKSIVEHICMKTQSKYIQIEASHKNLLQAMNTSEVMDFLIPDRH